MVASTGDVGVTVPPTAAQGLVWTVVGVDADDVLNARSGPSSDASIVGAYGPWETNIVVTGDRTDSGAGTWFEVDLGDGLAWVNARFLVGQPATLSPADEVAMVSAGEDLMLLAGGGEPPPLSVRGLWFGGIGVYADGPSPWQRIPGDALADPAGWREVRTFPFEPGFTCGADCDKSAIDFLHLDTLDDTTVVQIDSLDVDRINGFTDGALALAPPTLHLAVLDKPAADDTVLDWQRIHVVFDWSEGIPAIALVHTWGWTP